ncbi:MAG: carbohydrate ABC transporter substrate-binding protein, partial [Anaerococcus vaginalis]
MKKWKTTLVALLAVFALTSCGNNKANDTSNNAASNKSSETEKSSDNSEKAFEGKTLTLAGLD